MKTYGIANEAGQVVQFEVSNSGLTRSRACKVLAQAEGCRILAKPKHWSWLRQERFCVADVNGVEFSISEPFGDNSRYLVTPFPPRPVPEIHAVRKAFEDAEANPAWLRVLFLVAFAAILLAILRALRR